MESLEPLIKLADMLLKWIIVPIAIWVYRLAKDISDRIDRNERDIIELKVLHREREKDITEIKSNLTGINHKLDDLRKEIINLFKSRP